MIRTNKEQGFKMGLAKVSALGSVNRYTMGRQTKLFHSESSGIVQAM